MSLTFSLRAAWGPCHLAPACSFSPNPPHHPTHPSLTFTRSQPPTLSETHPTHHPTPPRSHTQIQRLLLSAQPLTPGPLAELVCSKLVMFSQEEDASVFNGF